MKWYKNIMLTSLKLKYPESVHDPKRMPTSNKQEQQWQILVWSL